jgi:succinate dehydrogenase flavin-adding protein (antitoxin of CptAB toxin-antitoxin module)
MIASRIACALTRKTPLRVGPGLRFFSAEAKKESGDENWMPSNWVNEDKDMSNLPGLSPEQLEKIAKTDYALREKHVTATPETDEARRKRMIYRSKQRGWLEADLLMGSWASKFVPGLSDKELDEYELLLKEETIDIYNYISAKDPLPPHLQGLGVMDKIQR